MRMEGGRVSVINSKTDQILWCESDQSRMRKKVDTASKMVQFQKKPTV
jgi:hypothetical protein